MNTKGGWHDAGDYNKFVPTTAVSAAFLLYAYEDFPDFFYDGQFNIPESHNSIPDVLDEACFALEWLIKMQRGDGAVYQLRIGPVNIYLIKKPKSSTFSESAVLQQQM